jgi:hypothetical protein
MMTFWFVAGFLACQPGDKPGAKESDNQTNQRAGDGEPKGNCLSQWK